MKRVLVFGGFGFLGHYLVKELLRRNYEVFVADINVNQELLSLVSYIKCDISNLEEVKGVFNYSRFEIVYNLAGFANLDQANEFPLKTMHLNVIGNIHILEACVDHKVSKYVYASSAYALSNKGSYYGISKLASEKIVEEYNKKHNLTFVILRYGSVYSELSYENNYIYNLVKEAVVNGLINHPGDGEEIREYIHAADAAKLSVDVIETELYNNFHMILTGTERIKRKELFNMIKEMLNDNVSISYSESAQSSHYKITPYSFAPSISKKLVANPHIDMGQGLLECIRAVHNNAD